MISMEPSLDNALQPCSDLEFDMLITTTCSSIILAKASIVSMCSIPGGVVCGYN